MFFFVHYLLTVRYISCLTVTIIVGLLSFGCDIREVTAIELGSICDIFVRVDLIIFQQNFECEFKNGLQIR